MSEKTDIISAPTTEVTFDLEAARRAVMDSADQPGEKIANAMLELGIDSSEVAVAEKTGIAVEKIRKIKETQGFWSLLYRQAKILGWTPRRAMMSCRAITSDIFEEAGRRYRAGALRNYDDKEFERAVKVGQRLGRMAERQLLNERLLLDGGATEDDEPSMRDLMDEVLKSEDARILLMEEARQGDEAAQRLLEAAPVDVEDIPDTLLPSIVAEEGDYVLIDDDEDEE